MEISTAHKGKPHISAEMWAELNRGIFGSESYVSEGGQKFKYELVSNNLLKIHDGSGMMQGRHVFIPVGQSDELTIENGNQGMKRIDLVVVRYTKDENTKIENTETVVIKGTPSESNPAVPAHIEGDIRSGDVKADWPLYEVELDGITVVEVRPVFKAILNMSTINKSLSDLSKQLGITKDDVSKFKYAVTIHRAPSENYSYAFHCGSIVPLGGIQIPTYSKGIFISNGANWSGRVI